ncbi:hypothetical protein VNO77_06859 [Canavalia gladiata]|uniref:Transmembrane protein n=1 Tax=Canavalia gladiata TaxID=3824 RepID=A0AAN9M811_CANGL
MHVLCIHSIRYTRTRLSIYFAYAEGYAEKFQYSNADMADIRGSRITFNILNVQVNSNKEIQTNPLDSFVNFVFLVLLTFLQIKYSQTCTPFQVHPNTVFVSIASFLVYCLVSWGRLHKIPIISLRHFDILVHLFLSLSLISLLSLLLPDTLQSLFTFVMYTLWFMAHALPMVYRFMSERWLQPNHQQMRRLVRPLLPTTSMDLN